MSLKDLIVSGNEAAVMKENAMLRNQVSFLLKQLREIADDPTGVSSYQAEIAKLAIGALSNGHHPTPQGE